MKRNHVLSGIIATASYILGILSTVLLKEWGSFTLDPIISFEINPLEPLVLICTILLGYYIAKVVSRDNETEFTYKNILVNRFDNFDSILMDDIKEILAQQHSELSEIVVTCKSIRKRINLLCDTAVSKGYYSDTDTDITAVNSGAFHAFAIRQLG
jgi:hypothetical protein